MKEFIQNVLVDEIRSQDIGLSSHITCTIQCLRAKKRQNFGIQCDEVRDGSNLEQLGLVVRYLNFLLQWKGCWNLYHALKSLVKHYARI